jgi:hypothetical protein
LRITGLLRAPGVFEQEPACILDQNSPVGLNDELWVQVTGAPPAPGTESTAASPSVAADQYILFLNGDEVRGIDPPAYRTYRLPGTGEEEHALVFKLRRNADNKEIWNHLLGSPTAFYKKVSVSVALKDKNGYARAAGGTASEFRLQLISLPRLLIAAFAILCILYVVWGHARTRTTLRDNLLPQLEPARQPYSLGRCQMAFWFVLIFVSFLFLYILLWDYNTVSPQALALMGISSATALASIAVDEAKDSPADATNRGLQALGLKSYEDVLRVKQEIADRTRTVVDLRQLSPVHSEIQDRQNILRTYEEKIRPFASQGFFADLATDINGPTLHRLQVILWTLAMGAVFIVGVYRDLAMPPDFSATLLGLMGLSSAGYVGFKLPEKNN